MYIKKILVAIFALIPAITFSQNYNDYELSTLKFVASGQSSTTQGEDLAIAQNALGIRYFNGSGGAPKDLQTAAYWFEKSATNGHVYGQYNIAWRYYHGQGVAKNYSKALYWFEKAGNQSHHESSLKAGKMHFYGEGTDVNYSKAILFFKDAAFGDIAEGKYFYALCFANGFGVQRDSTKTLIWANRAIDDEYYQAYWILGRMYQNGETVAKDDSKTLHYYKLGSDNGINSCTNDLGLGYEKGTFVEKDIYKALEYFTLAASNGYKYGKHNSARLYRNPENPFYSLEKAEMWYKSLVKDGYKEYESDLIDIYNTTGNMSEKFKIYKRKVDEGDIDYMNTLAYMYVRGEGTTASLEKAIETIEKALFLEPDNLAYLDTKGDIYLIWGDIKKAGKIWKKIVKKNPHFYDKPAEGYNESDLNKYFLENPL